MPVSLGWVQNLEKGATDPQLSLPESFSRCVTCMLFLALLRQKLQGAAVWEIQCLQPYWLGWEFSAMGPQIFRSVPPGPMQAVLQSPGEEWVQSVWSQGKSLLASDRDGTAGMYCHPQTTSVCYISPLTFPFPGDRWHSVWARYSVRLRPGAMC